MIKEVISNDITSETFYNFFANIIPNNPQLKLLFNMKQKIRHKIQQANSKIILVQK